jgi:hypothetical protein
MRTHILKQTRGVTLYLSREHPLLGDRVQHVSGKLGRVTEVRPGNSAGGFGELAIKWDDGVASRQYASANEFSLVGRPSGRLVRIPRETLAEMLRSRRCDPNQAEHPKTSGFGDEPSDLN